MDSYRQKKILLCLGDCQIPSIRHESLIETETVSQDEIQPGDLVVYSGYKNYVCHRVLYRKHFEGMLWYFIKPDNRLYADGWIPAYRVTGKVIRIDRTPVDVGKEKLKSWLLLWHSRVQWFIFDHVFRSKLGKWLGAKKAQHLTPRPIFVSLFARLSNPWQYRWNPSK